MYSTYSLYVSQGGTLDEQAYTGLADKAAREIDLRTFGRAQSYKDTLSDALGKCECELVDALSAEKTIPVGVSSESNDGYSISYAQNAVAEQKKQIEGILMRWLSEPVNLLFAGVLPCDFQ